MAAYGADPDDDDGVDVLDDGPPASGSGTRLLLLTAVVLLAALMTVVVVARTGERARPAPAPEPTATQDVRPSRSPSPSPSPDRPRPERVHDRLATAPMPDAAPTWELFVQDATYVHRINLASGERTRTRIEVAPQFATGGAFVPAPGGVLTYPGDSAHASWVPDDGPARVVPLTGPGERGLWTRVLPGPPGRVWVVRHDYQPAAYELASVGVTGWDGDPVRRLDAPGGGGWSGAVSDGSDGVLVPAAGGTWEVTPEGPRRISRGEVVAVGPRVQVLLDCDDTLVCSDHVRDRATGQQRRLAPARRDAGPGALGTTSPDGRWWAYWSVLPETRLVVVDLVTGEAVVQSGADASVDLTSTLAWTPDSSRLLALDGDGLRSVDPARGEERWVELPVPGAVRLALRG
ncbi:hypothetical protein GC722_15610 [Auraticoccus sp. F435]|uniref:Dipeptidylpeptidase IV N-terminal domain-containing protein n=1 Tax=Auraticoccus cholistanensis TaxID=2656650 RepID=A0A6A9UWW0_9ACTN|nr:hypothetical protein [Auraticoccus cholistanensis]MVA77436.1 hypothetical protein [Auraticoccus cholistanensis]